MCQDQLSRQSHYDFGLRALKSVLFSSGNLKRKDQEDNTDWNKYQDNIEKIEDLEQDILLRSICETIVPKLIVDDIPLLSSLLNGVFPGKNVMPIQKDQLKKILVELCKYHNLLPEEQFIQKCLQIYTIQFLHHGLMFVGPSGVGKTAAWKLLASALEK